MASVWDGGNVGIAILWLRLVFAVAIISARIYWSLFLAYVWQRIVQDDGENNEPLELEEHVREEAQEPEDQQERDGSRPPNVGDKTPKFRERRDHDSEE